MIATLKARGAGKITVALACNARRIGQLEEHVRYLRRHLGAAWDNGDFLRGQPSNPRLREKLLEMSLEIVPDLPGANINEDGPSNAPVEGRPL